MGEQDTSKEHFDALFRALQGAVNILDFEELLLVLVFQFQEILQFDCMLLQLIEDDDTTVKIYALNQKKKYIWGDVIPIGKTEVNDILRQMKPVLYHEITPRSQFKDSQYFCSIGSKALMRIPVRLKKQNLGVLNIVYFNTHQFDSRELKLAEVMANMIAYYHPERTGSLPQQRTDHTNTSQEKKAITIPFGFLQDLHSCLKILSEDMVKLETVDNQPLTEKQKDYLRFLTETERIIQNHLKTLIQYFEVEVGKVEPVKKPLKIDRYLREIFSEIQSFAATKRLKCFLEIEQGLPTLITDEGIVNRILRILLKNAVQYSKSGGKITITAANDSGGIRINVIDSAHPLSELERRRLLSADRISSSHQMKIPPGFSLILANRLTQLLQGELQVESLKGEGNIFSLIIHHK